MTYYLLLEHLEHPAETINAVRAWGSSVKNSKNIPRDGTILSFSSSA
jgi:hypothetical protein